MGPLLKTWFESLRIDEFWEDEGEISWRTATHGITAPEKNFRHGCRVLRARVLRFSQPLEVQHIPVSFVHTTSGLFVSGLVFVDKGGQHHALGYLHHDQSVLIQISTAQRIQGWELALDMSGIRAIAVITEDGTTSPWAGKPGDYPRWHLVEAEGISSIKGRA